MDSKDICEKLLRAESEKEVQSIINENPEMLKTTNWVAVDRRDTNFNVVTNQAMTGGKAATELMTNMVDAILMKAAYLKDIDPKGKDAPKSMHEAVDKLISNLRGGSLINADKAWLKEYSEKNLIIGISGSSGTKSSGGHPCLTFIDNGEGQNPENFEDTFLSLSKGNKKDINFVQGKFNMGSSGVLSFCGEHWFKLIISRRYDKKGKWGWTLVRKRPGKDIIPIAEYFTYNGEIPSFEKNNIFPLQKKNGNTFEECNLESGTIIKLYDFFLGSGYTGFRGAREAFNENLVETILPFRIYDLRNKPDTSRGGLRAEGIDARPFYGMEYLLLSSHAADGGNDEQDDEGVEDNRSISISSISDAKLGKIKIKGILLKDTPGWLKPSSSNNRVFHTVNGQVQFKQTRGFISSCGYPALKDRLVIIVNSSDLTFEAHNNVWKGDREHIRDTIVGDSYKSLIKETIQKSDILKELQQKIAREELTSSVKKETSDIFQKLVDNDKNLANLLNDNDPSIIIRVMSKEDTQEEYEGKYSPTFLELESKYKDKMIEIPINRSRPISAKTDVVNDYFHRADNTGYLYISDDEIEKNFRIRQSLKDGRLTVYLAMLADTDIQPGATFQFEIGLNDPSIPFPITVPVKILVTEPTATEDEEKKENRKKANKQKENQKPKKGLPKYKLLTKDGREIPNEDTEEWPDDFNDYDGGIVEDFGEDGLLYKINYDNAYHIKYRQSKKTDLERDALTKKYILGMRLLMLGFEHSLRNVTNDEVEEYKDEFRRFASKGAASTVLSIAEVLPKIIDLPEDIVE